MVRHFYVGQRTTFTDDNPVPWIDLDSMAGDVDNEILKDNWPRDNLVFRMRDDAPDSKLYMVHHVVPPKGVARYLKDVSTKCWNEDTAYKTLSSISWCPRFVDQLFIRTSDTSEYKKLLGQAYEDGELEVRDDIFDRLNDSEMYNYVEAEIGCWVEVFLRDTNLRGEARIYQATGFVTAAGQRWQEFEVAFIPAIKNPDQPELLTIEEIEEHFAGEYGIDVGWDLKGNEVGLVHTPEQRRLFWNGLEKRLVNIKQVCEPMKGMEQIDVALFREAFHRQPNFEERPNQWIAGEYWLKALLRAPNSFGSKSVRIARGPFMGHHVVVQDLSADEIPGLQADEVMVELLLDKDAGRKGTMVMKVCHLRGDVEPMDLVFFQDENEPSGHGYGWIVEVNDITKPYKVLKDRSGEVLELEQHEMFYQQTRYIEFEYEEGEGEDVV
ncbi:hypothetical protein DFP72DRAFT_1072184 [Ephemerocybe angulata]|uniref:Uncharacterized protein n=1 Tax=Ephemerocybe angulata TaxID=980116 RepID=A0A8H6LV43_9AGAR|nr:hypothetical protein DFP72DRAFT_1082209 [Tulosesus angulatus]KAF6750461.1 hypothetical protein DFP72DRAFT_1072184 [Tulosesus angulatus]